MHADDDVPRLQDYHHYAAPAGRRAEAVYPGVLRGLREIDPRMELLYLGEGKWVLGSFWPDRNRHRARGLRRILEKRLRTEKAAGPLALALLRAQLAGFRPIAEVYTEEQVASRWIVEDFRRRDFNYRTRREETLDEKMRVADGSAKLEADLDIIREKLEADYRSIHKYAFRHAKGFHVKQSIGA